MEAEHIVPAEHFGRTFSEWRDGAAECVGKDGKPFKGRKCAEKASKDFRRMEADLYNLWPASGAVNAARGNMPYAAIAGDAREDFGSCGVRIADGRFEPPARAKGIVARASLYMADAYPRFRLSRQQTQLFEAWSRQHPVTEWECKRTRLIERHQGNVNDRVRKPCREKGWW